MTLLIRFLLLVVWKLSMSIVIALAIANTSAQPWLIALVWGLPIGWVVAWRIRQVDHLGIDDPPLLHSLMLTSTDDNDAMHGFNALVAQVVAAIIILCGTIAVIRLGYEFPWYNGLITLGACMLAQYYDLHFQRNTTSTKSTDTGCSAGPDGTF